MKQMACEYLCYKRQREKNKLLCLYLLWFVVMCSCFHEEYVVAQDLFPHLMLKLYIMDLLQLYVCVVWGKLIMYTVSCFMACDVDCCDYEQDEPNLLLIFQVEVVKNKQFMFSPLV